MSSFIIKPTAPKAAEPAATEAPNSPASNPTELKPPVSNPPVSAPPVSEVETPPAKWDELGLSSELIAILVREGLTSPTPVQAKSIPRVLERMDVIVSAQTGTGKTAAFALPIIEKVKGRQGTYAVVLCPTREIALQTQKVFVQFGQPLGVKSVSLIGGTDLKTDEELLRTYPQVIIATPGRMVDHIERGGIWLEYMEMLVLDEADRMLDMGFSTQLNRILDETSDQRQTLLFSATLSPGVEKLSHSILYQPERIQVGKPSRSATTVDQRFVFLDEADKFHELEHLLYEERGTIFVFTRSKDSAARLWRSLRNRGFHEATQLHSNLSQSVREEALEDFKKGKYRVLIATDVVGRGIHVDEVAHVINYDFPRDAEDYVHRIGRTGRAENTGIATSLVTPRDYPVLKRVETLIGRKATGPIRNSGGGQSNQKKSNTGARGAPSGRRRR